MNSMPSLVQKAVHDSGYDVVVPEHDGWVRAQVSGSERAVWIRVDTSGIWLAMKGTGIPARIGLLDVDTVPPPGGLASTGRVSAAGELYHALHLIASLQGNPVPTLSDKVAARLAAIPVTEHTGLSPVSQTPCLGVMMKPEVANGKAKDIYQRVQG